MRAMGSGLCIPGNAGFLSLRSSFSCVRPTFEEASQVPCAGAVHGVHHYGEARILQGGQVHRLPQVLQVGVGRVDVANEALLAGLGQGHAADLAGVAQPGNAVLHRLQQLRRSAAAVVRAVLHAVPEGGVVARGDHDAPGGPVLDDAPADHGGGRRPRAENHREPVAGQDLGDGSRELLRSEAGVVAHDHGLLGQSLVQVVRGYALGAGPDVVEGEVLGDDRPPAVRAELDCRRVHASAPVGLAAA